MLIYGTPHFIAPERLRGRRGDFRTDIFEIGTLWYAALTGEVLPDPRNADPVSVAQRLDLPPTLRAVLLGALEIRPRRHHSAASMLNAIEKALEDIRGRRQRARRLGAFAPLLSLLAFPAWLAIQPATTEPTCPPLAPSPTAALAIVAPVTPASEPQAAGPVAPASGPAASAGPAAEPQAAPVAPASDPEPTAPAPEPRVRAEKPGSAPAGAKPVDTVLTSAPRFDLRSALAKCKPHPTARIEITINPGEPVQIDGDRATGELGRCVEDVLTAHPPQRAETIKL
ncbi:hypothetical protein [Nannocystis pusilla]|uniref:Protein kinase domain-containing protein n=1 Tax=Nannocystis pusilla TaxID=889268 RepID=A0ABS7TXX7_9BACT|nr:hypothetical protein [Nannocystis pusilla]MBZ5713006.1 hypothetical protein [Nannocystis pusilla]